MGGAVAGGILGFVNGGWEGALKGAAMGFVMGALMGIGLQAGGAYFAAGALIGGAAYSTATGGAEGLGDFAAGAVGSMSGYYAGNAMWHGTTNLNLQGIPVTSGNSEAFSYNVHLRGSFSSGQLQDAYNAVHFSNFAPAVARANVATEMARAAQMGKVGRCLAMPPSLENRVSKITETRTAEFWLPDYMFGDPIDIHVNFINYQKTVDYIMVPSNYILKQINVTPNTLVKNDFRGLTLYRDYKKTTEYIYGPR